MNAIESKTFSDASRKLALSAVCGEDKAEKAKFAFYAAILKEGILPSSLDFYREDGRAICLTTFPKKVQDGIASKLIRKDDLIRGVNSERTGKPLKKVDWQNQVNKKVSRLFGDYAAYLARHHDLVEAAGKLIPVALDDTGRAVKLPKAEKSPAITHLEAAFRGQVFFSNIATPTTAEVELAKLYTKVCDYLKALTPEAKKRFNELSAPKVTGSKKVTAAVKKK